MAKEILPDEYLDKNFNYEKCTKDQLRRIMFDNGIEDIPPLTAKKSEIIQYYKKTIHDNIELLKEKYKNVIADGHDITNFSDENVFQSEDDKSRNNNSGSNYENDSEEDVVSLRRNRAKPLNKSFNHYKSPRRSFISNNQNINSPFSKKMNLINTPEKNIFWNKSSRDDSFRNEEIKRRLTERETKINDSSEESDQKNPFIEQQNLKKVDNVSPMHKIIIKENPNLPRFVKYTPRRKQWFFIFYISFLISFLVYLRFFCPYCTKGSILNIFNDPLNIENYCLPIPSNSSLKNDRIECKPGFKPAWYSFIKKTCIMDKKKEKEREKQIKELISFLKRARTEFEYGFRRSPKIELSQIKISEEIMNIILTYKEIKKDDKFIYSTESQFVLKIFLRFYFSKIIRFLGIPILIITLSIASIKYYFVSKRRKRENIAKANEVLKKVMNTLTSQVLFHSRDTKIDPFIPITQLKDLFSNNNKVWKIVVEKIRVNSNIREYSAMFKGEKQMVWEYVGPSVFSHIGIKSDEEISSYVNKNFNS
ncbi:Inner nuclear membrane protein SRC1 [Dictyocoela muelleri]|nr:Inner nuclear membrane protein SRC1 [Dictyocoela muelleri]